MAEAKHGNQPITINETVGKKAYCTCGHSMILPYCDGAHSKMQTGLSPIVVEITNPGQRAVCQCHRSECMPWCDGIHSKL